MTLSARLVSIRSWWLKLGSALTGDVPHPFAEDYWPGCWCSKPWDDKVHAPAWPLTAPLKPERHLSAVRQGRGTQGGRRQR